MKNLFIVLLAGLFFSLAGCSTIMTGTTEKITIDTPPIAHASCLLSNDRGQWVLADTPGVVKVHKSNAALHVSCHKSGYYPNTTEVSSQTQSAVIGNFLAGGIIGVMVDVEDGAAFKYPKNIVMPLRKLEDNGATNKL